jgi:uncharacterized protein YfdQ (DUF2303 family)
MKPEDIKFLTELHAPVIANAQRPIIGPEADGKDHIPFVLIPNNMKVEALKPILDAWLPKPERRKGTAIAHNAESFVLLTERFKTNDSVIYCKGHIDGNTIEAQLLSILNYNPISPDNLSADWGDHCVRYDFPVSKDLKRWINVDGQNFDQAEFAAFLEDNARDLVIGDIEQFDPDFFGSLKPPAFASPSDIIQLSRGIEIRAKERVHNAFRHQDGTMNMVFTTEHEGSDGQPLSIPEWFMLGVQVFEDGEWYQIPVRLRYRVSQGRVQWFFQIYRLKSIFDQAFDKVCKDAAEKLSLPLFKGIPEGK